MRRVEKLKTIEITEQILRLVFFEFNTKKENLGHMGNVRPTFWAAFHVLFAEWLVARLIFQAEPESLHENYRKFIRIQQKWKRKIKTKKALAESRNQYWKNKKLIELPFLMLVHLAGSNPTTKDEREKNRTSKFRIFADVIEDILERNPGLKKIVPKGYWPGNDVKPIRNIKKNYQEIFRLAQKLGIAELRVNQSGDIWIEGVSDIFFLQTNVCLDRESVLPLDIRTVRSYPSRDRKKFELKSSAKDNGYYASTKKIIIRPGIKRAHPHLASQTHITARNRSLAPGLKSYCKFLGFDPVQTLKFVVKSENGTAY